MEITTLSTAISKLAQQTLVIDKDGKNVLGTLRLIQFISSDEWWSNTEKKRNQEQDVFLFLYMIFNLLHFIIQRSQYNPTNRSEN